MSDAPRPIDLSLFEESVPASEDFYRHVNGGWLDANPVPPEYPSWGAFHEVNNRNQELLRGLLEEAAAEPQAPGTPSRMAGDYYAAAMDEQVIAEAGVGPLSPLLDRIDAVKSVADVRDVVRDLQQVGVGALHSLGVSSDFEDADRYLVYIGQGGLGLPERDYYLRDDERSVELRRRYVEHVARQLENAGVLKEAAQDAAERILAFETRLADASYPAEKMRDVQLTLNRHEVATLDDLMPAFGLGSYVRELGVTAGTVNVDNAGFFTALQVALSDTPVETLRDYLRWHLVRAYASSLPKAFEEESFAFYGRTLSGQKEMRPRWKRALDAASSDIGEQVARLYVDAAFSEQAKKRCEEMVDHLLSSMGAAIREAAWMTEATKEQALEKLAGFGYKIGFPDKWRDYSRLEIERGPYATNRMRAARFEYDREMGRLGEPVDKSEWEMPAHIVNAYYHPLLNEVVFPAGILQPPFFYAEADDAVNFGAIGAVIGHEITHGFDDQGSRFDARGSLRDWWTEADRGEFDRRAEVLVEQYDGYAVAEGAHVNGRLTLGENIADLGGVTVALQALREAGGAEGEPLDGFTPVQRFFVSYATVWRTNHTEEYVRLLVNVDPHSPARFRVDGPLANLPAFAEAFGLQEGSPMRRPAEKRAHIW
jgi:predicted metalloendopeptidase